MSLRVERSETTQSQYPGITSLRYRCVRNNKCSTGHDIIHRFSNVQKNTQKKKSDNFHSKLLHHFLHNRCSPLANKFPNDTVYLPSSYISC